MGNGRKEARHGGGSEAENTKEGKEQRKRGRAEEETVGPSNEAEE